MTPESMMQLALDAAWRHQGMTYPNPAVGCSVCGSRGELLAVGAHERAGGPHAEVLALKTAYRLLSGDGGIDALADSARLHDYLRTHHDNLLHDTTLYVTLEPCSHHGKTPSCALLIRELGVRKVVIAHEDPNPEAAGGAALLEAAGIETEFGLLREKANELLYPFLTWQNRPYVFFKWAQRLDGTVDGGTVSCETSRRKVHGMRSACDLMVIGGSTVRHDRPTLDARLTGGKAPDVLIYSRVSDFDREIPLFSVPGRKVIVSNSLDAIEEYRNVMVEGGPGMFEALNERVDRYLCFIAPSSGGTIPFTKHNVAFDMLHSMESGSDLMLWLKGK